MHSLFGKRGVLLAGLLALAVTALAPSIAEAKPEPGAKPRGFRLFARSLGAITINRIYCGLATTGEVCVDSTNSSTIGGGYWPKGTANQFVFNSGLQLAGVIADTPDNPWGGDTTGAFFFDPKGTTQHGQQVEPIYNSTNPDDVANWPQAAFVPQGDAGEELFNPLLRGRVAASQADVWWLSWEGNPSQNAGRSHPLGIAVESRGLGWNFPAGNEDIIYFIYTFYNVTSLNPADYAAIRPGLREIMISRAQEFHSLNNAAFGIDLPDGGYTIENMFAAFGADMDVTGDAGNNYSSVVLPFAMGHTYLADFHKPAEFTFDPGIFGPPFFESAGFVGVKYLKSPTGAGAIQLFSNTINGGAFNDAANTKQLFRYLSATLSPAQGDAPCNTGSPTVTHICYVNNGNSADMRFFQSSTPLTLAPGQFGSIVVAYIFAAPYQPASYVPGTEVRPEQPFRLASADARGGPGANMIDSIAGFLDFNDANVDGIPQQNEFTVVQGSLLGKSLVAQAVFDSKFLLPFAPESPEFYLVPGDNQVSILWRPSPSEVTGDPFFNIAKDATIIPAGGGDPVPNPLYDPNYRQFDVEGYRIYRGRVDAPNTLTLIAQFDYSGTVIQDFSGSVNPIPACAPELNIIAGCHVAYNPAEFAPGIPRTVFEEKALFGQISQIKVPGGRVALADGNAILLAADTALTGGGAGFPELTDTGVPFVFIDNTVRNNFRYFYSVTAFDINSFQSGPSNLESARLTKAVIPTRSATNALAEGQLSFGLFGADGTELDANTPFSIDAQTGRFSGTPPATNAIGAAFAPLIPALLPALTLVATIDSVLAFSAIPAATEPECATVAPGNFINSCHVMYVTFNRDGAEQSFTIPLVWPIWTSFGEPQTNTVNLGAFPIAPDAGSAATNNLPGGLTTANAAVTGNFTQYIDFSAFEGQAGRRDRFGDGAGFSDGGSRWFEGENETLDDPAYGHRVGHLTGVDTIWGGIHHVDQDPLTAGVQTPANSGTVQFFGYHTGALGRMADVRFTWGPGGTMESVEDLTHHVPVPFKERLQASWGFIPDGDGDGKIHWEDQFYIDGICVFWFEDIAGCDAAAVSLTNTAVVTDVSTSFDAAAASPVTGQGFGLYVNGERYIFQLTGGALPAAGTQWTLRTYTGRVDVSAGIGTTDPSGYRYRPAAFRSPSIPGLQVRFNFSEAATLVTATEADLEQVHTVPDPYYVTSEFEQTTDNKVIKFVNLPHTATIRIYSSSGVLVSAIEHNSSQLGGTADWNVRNRNNQVVASGVYFYHIESGDARRVGRFTIVNFAQ